MKITTIKLLAFALAITVCAGGALLLLPNPAHAVVCPATGDTTDADGDGFSNVLECSGITLTDSTVVPSCAGGEDRNSCVDPNSKDVFVILVPVGNGSLLGADPLEILKRTAANGGLGIAIHQITAGQATSGSAAAARKVGGTNQKAIRITENLSTNGSVTGICTQGTPNGTDNCVVYTQKIVNVVNAACPSGTACLVNGSNTNSVPTVISTYIKNTLAHEASHSMKLTTAYNAKNGGNHYQIGTNVVMDQSVYYTTGGGSTTFFLPGTYTDPDRAGAALK